MGGPGFKTFFEKLEKLYGSWIEPQSYHLTIKEISKGPLLFQDLKIISKPMAHITGSIGYRIGFRDGKSITISGDTDYCQNIIDLAFETDLLILNAPSLMGKKWKAISLLHWLEEFIRIALQKKLLLTHLYPVCDQFDIVGQCKRIYQGDMILGEDLMRVII